MKSLHIHYKSKGMNTRGDVSLQAAVENCMQRWCGRDMARQSVPDTTIRAAAVGKARSNMVGSRVRQTGSDDVDADRRRDLIPRSAG